IERAGGRDRGDRRDRGLREQAQDLRRERAAIGGLALLLLGAPSIVIPADLAPRIEWLARRRLGLGCMITVAHALLTAMAADSTERAATFGLGFGHAASQRTACQRSRVRGTGGWQVPRANRLRPT